MFADGLREMLAIEGAIPQPCARYQTNPCGFADDILGIELWSKQREILEAVVEFFRVSVRSGHKCGKSTTAAVIALWFYFCFEDARVVLSSVTSRQVDQILWREIRKLRARSKQHIVGEMHELARSGFKAPAELGDFREIVGFTAREAEAVAGISGANLIYILDEASGIPEEIFEAIEGNRAGGARLVMFSNPTRTTGEFYLSHTDKAIVKGNDRGFYKTIHVSSAHTPNVIEGRTLIPGLAGREWVEEKAREWGKESPLYKVRVEGEFVIGEDGKILSLHAITEAEGRWEGAAAEGRLFIGIDPAGPAEGGDESAFALRRGKKIMSLIALRGLTEADHVAHTLGFIAEHRKNGEAAPVVVVDREGPIGSAVYGLFRAHLEQHRDAFQIVGVRASDRARRQPALYDRVRDELWANFDTWLREDGAIPSDAKLAKELHAPSWEGQVTGRLKATPKSELRKILGRSPDRADAACLSTWEPLNLHDDDERGAERQEKREPSEVQAHRYGTDAGSVFDPYGGAG